MNTHAQDVCHTPLIGDLIACNLRECDITFEQYYTSHGAKERSIASAAISMDKATLELKKVASNKDAEKHDVRCAHLLYMSMQ